MVAGLMPPFKDGTCANTIDRAGLVQRYIRVSAGPQRGQYVHRMIAAAKLGRPLRDDEEVDHDNGDTFDNAPENLIVRTMSEHAKLTRQRSQERKMERYRRMVAKRLKTKPDEAPV